MNAKNISIGSEKLNIGQLLNQLRNNSDDIGAMASFCGIVRGHEHINDKRIAINALELEHYPGMSEKKLHQIADKATQKWSLKHLVARHRIGKINVGEDIVFVGTSAQHRQAAFDACHYIVDWLKTDAPFWKCAYDINGNRHYINARESDVMARNKWEQ